MNRETLDRFCERGILALVLAILVFGPLATAAVSTHEFVVIMVLTAGVLVLWGVRLWAQESPKLLCPPICWPVLAFTAYAIWCYAHCDIEYVGRLELLRLLVYAFLFFAILNNLHRQETMQVIVFTLVFLAMALSFIALWQWFTRTNKVPSLSAMLEWLFLPNKNWWFPRVYGARASATYISPNHLAGFLEMLLPLALTCTLVGRSKVLMKVFLGYAALVILVGVGTTVSRGSWLGCGVATLMLFAVLATFRAYRLPAMLVMVVLVGVSTFAVTRTDFIKERFRRTFNAGHVDFDTRQLLWDSTMRMWRDHRWQGVGPGHFDYRFREYRPMEVQLRPDHAHNEYLDLLANWGVVGAVVVGAGVLIFFAGVVRTWRFVRREERELGSSFSNKFAHVLGGALGLVALFIHSLVDFNLQIPANAILAVTLVALVSSHLRFATEKYWLSAGAVVKVLVTFLLLAGAGLFAQQSVRLGREYLWLERVAVKPKYSDEAIACLQAAWAVESKNFETAHELGQAFRTQSYDGGDDWGQLATNAMTWYASATVANPHDARNYLFYGACLDWAKRSDESGWYFSRADELDPNGYAVVAGVAKHYREIGDFPAERTWAERSLKLQRAGNTAAESELGIATREMLRVVPRTNNPSVPLR